MKTRTVIAWIVGALLGAKCFLTFNGRGGTITIDTDYSVYMVLGAFIIAGAALAKIAADVVAAIASKRSTLRA